MKPAYLPKNLDPWKNEKNLTGIQSQNAEIFTRLLDDLKRCKKIFSEEVLLDDFDEDGEKCIRYGYSLALKNFRSITEPRVPTQNLIWLEKAEDIIDLQEQTETIEELIKFVKKELKNITKENNNAEPTSK